MVDFNFDFITGAIRIPLEAPADWLASGLSQFYLEPNKPAWGALMCRELCHESLHFWQLLSSRYLMALAADEWERMEAFERTRALPAVPGRKQHYVASSGAYSAHALAECWARYWDVHLRSPAVIALEEELEVPGPLVGPLGYSSSAFDAVMSQCKDSQSYADPYRNLLGLMENHSAYAAICFPFLVFWAFNSDDPAAAFQEMAVRAWESGAIREAINRRSGNINLDWYGLWEPLKCALQPPEPGGVLAAGEQGEAQIPQHPLLDEYLWKYFDILPWANKRLNHLGGPTNPWVAELYYTLLAAVSEPSLLFILPGQPDARNMLGRALEPPVVRFRNGACYAREGASKSRGKLDDGIERASLAPLIDEIQRKASQFRLAEDAVRLGLPPGTFLTGG